MCSHWLLLDGEFMRKTVLFNDGWEFVKAWPDTLEKNISEASWGKIDIPHDWLIYDTNNLYEDSIGWYRKIFEFTPDESSKYAIRFDGVYMEPVVFVNGIKAGEWKYGYNTFELDITQLLKDGTNEIKVKVTHNFPNSRWYSGAGIYRNIWFKQMPLTHIVSDGIYIRTEKSINGFDVNVSTEVDGATSDTTIFYYVIDADGNTVATEDYVPNHTEVISVRNPRLWDIDDPYLYTLRTDLLVAGEVIDSIDTKFGFRTIEFTCNNGFFLNGKHLKLNGVCLHHDLGSLGAAINQKAIKRQLLLMKEMGANAIRTSHNMPAPEVLDVCDEIGLLVNEETFDMWELPKNKFDYGRFFNEWAVKDIRNFVRRDRNHPCIIMWSLGNEIYDTHADEVRGKQITKMLLNAALESDPARNAIPTFGSNFLEGQPTQNCADLLKVVGYNYSERLYNAHHELHPDWAIYGSETSSTLQSRGVYHFPYSEPILTDIDEQCSSLGNSTCSWGAKNTEACIISERDNEFSAGQFIWTGMDYIGEPTPYQTKNSYFGQVDTAGFPKDTYYIYQAEWTDYKKKPMVHLFPYWDFNEGQIIDIRVASNAPCVELFFNGESQGRFEIDHAHGKQLVGHWQLPFHKGTIEAVAYDENDIEIAREVQKSYGEATSIKVASENERIHADGRDLAFVQISMEDAFGNEVKNANNLVKVTVEGPGRLIGLDNGDSTDYDQYKGNSRRLFMGKLLAIVAPTNEPGDIIVKVSSPELESATVVIPSVATEAVEGTSFIQKNYDVELEDEIPIRKIEIVSPSGTSLDENSKEIHLDAVLSPSNCTCKDIEWCVINDSGVPSNLATITPDENGAVLKAMGDGKFSVRCYTRNGRSKVNVISQLNFTVSGIGSAYINPYEPIAAALYNTSKGELGNASEHAIATQKAAETYLGFTNVDFGDFGADEVELNIFTFDQKDYKIQVWSGVPDGPDSELLMEGAYNMPVIWDVYQGQKFALNRRIKGVHDIYVRTEDFINLRDFVFTLPDKGFAKIHAGENDNMYGDDFKIDGLAVNGIGNNVSIEFSGMDFRDGVDAIEISGISYIDVNTINVLFTNQDGSETRRMLAFEKNSELETKQFDIDMVSGLNKVTFVFLPGSNFDFDWFRFYKK